MNSKPETIVVVEGGLGPTFGYYHNQDAGTTLGAEEMTKKEAREEGYSPCSTCFPEDIDG